AEAGQDLASQRVEVERDLDLEVAVVVTHRHNGAEVPATGRDREEGVMEADSGELEGVPVEGGGELVEDVDALCWGSGAGLFCESAGLGERAALLYKAGWPKSSGAGLAVGVAGGEEAPEPVAAEPAEQAAPAGALGCTSGHGRADRPAWKVPV